MVQDPSLLELLILAVIEGITEYLPVSSTGHMVLAAWGMGLEPTDWVKSYLISVQFGAILAAIWLYRERLRQGWSVHGRLLLAFVPAVLIGLALKDQIDRWLESPTVVAAALVGGGLVLLLVDRLFPDERAQISDMRRLSWRASFSIGLIQTFALIPGVSRSAATIVGGLAMGLNRQAAAEFSFLLAIPTLTAAAGYKTLKMLSSPEVSSQLISSVGSLAMGNIVSFVVAWLAIRGFVGFLQRNGFFWFGVYRIILGSLILLILF
jgi:undecaprenyl-diphosphatase